MFSFTAFTLNEDYLIFRNIDPLRGLEAVELFLVIKFSDISTQLVKLLWAILGSCWEALHYMGVFSGTWMFMCVCACFFTTGFKKFDYGVFFTFLVLEVHWASWMYEFIVLPNLENFHLLFLQKFFSLSNLLFLLETPVIYMTWYCLTAHWGSVHLFSFFSFFAFHVG